MTLVVPCNKGGVPHLTADLVGGILSLPQERLVAVSVVDVVDFSKLKSEGNKHSFLSFVGLDGRDPYTVFLTARSALLGPHCTAPTTNVAIAGSSDNGRVLVGQDDWARCVASVRPTFASPLYDSPFAPGPVVLDGAATSANGSDEATLEGPQPPTKKRRLAAADRSKKWYQAAASSGVCKLLIPWSALSDGEKKATPATAWRDVDGGIIVDTLNHFEPIGERMKQIAAAASWAGARLGQSSSSSQIIYCQCENAQAMLLSLIAGATHVECGFPFLLAQKGIALTFRIDDDNDEEVAGREVKGVTSSQGSTAASSSSSSVSVLEDLHDPRFRIDASPLSSRCRCYSCKRHTRAYIHHLLLVQEMNSEVLLSIHNLTQVVDILRFYRSRTASAGAEFLRRVLNLNF